MIGNALLVLAAATAVSNGQRCALQGWSNDTDPTGLRVRAGPALSAREIGRLPPAIRTGDEHAPEFDILDVQNGWVRIANVTDESATAKVRAALPRTGWVHGSRVVFSVQSSVGRSRPDVGAPVVVRGSDWLGNAGGTVQPIMTCSGGWARLRYRMPAELSVIAGSRTGEAWFGGICGSQHTTCDSLDEKRSVPGR